MMLMCIIVLTGTSENVYSFTGSIGVVIQLDHPLVGRQEDEQLRYIADHYVGISDRKARLTKKQRARLRQLNPDILILRYLNFSEIYTRKLPGRIIRHLHKKQVSRHSASIVLLNRENQPEPALWSRNGSGITVDPASPLWRSFLVHTAVQAVVNGYDGILADSCLMAGELPASFAGLDPVTGQVYTSTSFRRAQYGNLRAVRQAIKAVRTDALLVANSIGSGTLYFNSSRHALPASAFLKVTDGVVAEGFLGKLNRQPEKPLTKRQWLANLKMMREISGQHKICIVVFKYRRDLYEKIPAAERQASDLFNLATVLLAKGKKTFISSMVLDAGHVKKSFHPYPQIWETNIGRPLGPCYRQGDLRLRKYTSGLVLVNPGHEQRMAFLGDGYFLPDRREVYKIKMEAHTGLILSSEPGR
jgi:hypothetical protein